MAELIAIFNKFIQETETVFGQVHYDDIPDIEIPVSARIPVDTGIVITESYILDLLKAKAPPRSWFEEQLAKLNERNTWLSNMPTFMIEKCNIQTQHDTLLDWYETYQESQPYFENGKWKRNSTKISLIETLPLDALKDRLRDHIANYRYQIETSSITLNGAVILTDRESQASTTGGWVKAKDNPDTVIDWKGANGWVILDAATMVAIGDAVFNHVQQCFSRERQLNELIDQVTISQDLLTIPYTEGWPIGA